MQFQTTEINREIRNYLTKTFLFGHAETLNDDTPLLGSVLDSQGVIDLVLFVQQHYKIEVDDVEVTPDNMATLKKFVTLIEAKLQSKR